MTYIKSSLRSLALGGPVNKGLLGLAWLYYTSLGRHSTIATGYASGSLRGEIGAPPEGRLYPKALPEHNGQVRGGFEGLVWGRHGGRGLGQAHRHRSNRRWSVEG